MQHQTITEQLISELNNYSTTFSSMFTLHILSMWIRKIPLCQIQQFARESEGLDEDYKIHYRSSGRSRSFILNRYLKHEMEMWHRLSENWAFGKMAETEAVPSVESRSTLEAYWSVKLLTLDILTVFEIIASVRFQIIGSKNKDQFLEPYMIKDGKCDRSDKDVLYASWIYETIAYFQGSPGDFSPEPSFLSRLFGKNRL